MKTASQYRTRKSCISRAFASRAKAPPAKGSEKGYGNESEFQPEWAQSTCSVMRFFTVMSLLGVLQTQFWSRLWCFRTKCHLLLVVKAYFRFALEKI